MKEIFQKTISLIATLALLGLAIKWVREDESGIEPIITLIGTLVTLFFQITSWKVKGKMYLLHASPTGEPQAIPRLFDFENDEFQTIVHPESTRKEHW